MGSMDAGWDLSLAIATKCGGADHHQLHLAGVVLFICTFMFFIHWASPGGSAWGKLRRPKDKPIPGPRGLPIIGSMNLMHGLAHRKLAAEAEAFKAWRLMAFSLGNTRVIITSDSDVAKEILNSSAFADRPVKESAYALMFHRAIGFAPYGIYWRTLRRIAATHFFSPKQLAASYPQRAEIADQMVAALKALSFSDVFVRARDVLKLASLNNIMWSVFGRRYELLSESDEEMQVLKTLVDEGYELLGKLNWSDHLTFLSGFDPQGIRFRCTRLVPKVNQFVTRLIDDHRAVAAAAAKQVPDFVDVLLSLPDADRLSDPDMVAVLWEMIFRGTDTVAVLIEWVLARLVMHGDVQEEVHKELDRVVGVHRAVTETDTGSLVYLNALIKEKGRALDAFKAARRCLFAKGAGIQNAGEMVAVMGDGQETEVGMCQTLMVSSASELEERRRWRRRRSRSISVAMVFDEVPRRTRGMYVCVVFNEMLLRVCGY
ncbi:hypothetical protein J5N97_025368 [Dioscorea zingiberensis]|uniref:Cytochrome P450 n=1 Tax=Dioscorea zingiberensis TaxID=325984 RepID=A0A9D5C8E8_9LILI|nr:hypothetical protein J5N97_025368 [Dioscorea zingiberensis]